MTLTRLQHCWMYRDGGSLEAVWHTDTGATWSVTLKIVDWDEPAASRSYQLFNCAITETGTEQCVLKGSETHLQIVRTIQRWQQNREPGTSSEPAEDNRLDEFLEVLFKGNY